MFSHIASNFTFSVEIVSRLATFSHIAAFSRLMVPRTHADVHINNALALALLAWVIKPRPGTQLPFLFCDGPFLAYGNRGFPKIPTTLIFKKKNSHLPVTRLLSSVTYTYIQYLTLVIIR